MQRLITALVASLFVTLSLKGLHAFHFITWNPIHFLQKFDQLDWTTLACWMVLFFMIFAVAYLLLYLFQFAFFQAPFVVSLIFGIAVALLIEWQVRNLPIEWDSMKKLSVPFIVLLLISMRFLSETAYSMRK